MLRLLSSAFQFQADRVTSQPNVRAPASLDMRDYTEADLDALKRLSEQPSIRRLTGLPANGDAAAWDAYIRARHHKTSRILIIEIDGAPVGVFYLINLGEPEIYQVGYCVDEAHRGRGVATRAVKAVIGSLFQGTACERVQATVEPHNAASIRVLEKCGLEREGLLRRGVKVGRSLVDAYIYSVLRGDLASAAEAVE